MNGALNERAAWVGWLVTVGYGYDWRNETDPPCSLSELTAEYARRSGETYADWAGSVELALGPWGQGARGGASSAGGTPSPDACPDCGLTSSDGTRLESELMIVDTHIDSAGHIWTVSQLAVP